MAIPNFYSMDKDLRDLMKIHIFIPKRGFAIIHVAKEDRMYNNDPWDVEHNKKIENEWSKIMKKDPDFIPPYHKLSTFVGYLTFGDLKAGQRKLYEEIKRKKRAILYENLGGKPKTAKEVVIEKAWDGIQKGFLTPEKLKFLCWANDVDEGSVRRALTEKVKKEDPTLNLNDYMKMKLREDIKLKEQVGIKLVKDRFGYITKIEES